MNTVKTFAIPFGILGAKKTAPLDKTLIVQFSH